VPSSSFYVWKFISKKKQLMKKKKLEKKKPLKENSKEEYKTSINLIKVFFFFFGWGKIDISFYRIDFEIFFL
jgi:hypothetical protein